jgi:hypothetical protein
MSAAEIASALEGTFDAVDRLYNAARRAKRHDVLFGAMLVTAIISAMRDRTATIETWRDTLLPVVLEALGQKGSK